LKKDSKLIIINIRIIGGIMIKIAINGFGRIGRNAFKIDV